MEADFHMQSHTRTVRHRPYAVRLFTLCVNSLHSVSPSEWPVRLTAHSTKQNLIGHRLGEGGRSLQVTVFGCDCSPHTHTQTHTVTQHVDNPWSTDESPSLVNPSQVGGETVL